MAGNQGILGAGVAWILGPQEIPVGVGILVGARELVTCAHVANVAVGRNPRHQACPEGPIRVGFPFLAASGSPTPSRAARVASWTPPAAAGVTGDDVAGLVITDPGGAPQEAVPSRLLLNPPVPGQEVHIFGCPPERPRGVWTVAIVRGVVGDGRLQLDADPTAAWPVRPGFSGSPVWEPVTGRLAGIVVATAAGMGRDSYAILAGQLRLAWPEVLDPRCRATGHAGKGTCRGKLIERTRRTVLHISEPRLAAAKPIAEGSGHQASAPVREALFEHLHDDLEALAEQHDVRPDTIVVTGGLSQHGRRTEFSVANEFLGALAEAVEIPKSRVAIVPGSTDVNRRACAAYFAEQEADEREPTAPYWPKWKHFSEAFERFYSGTVPATYTPDEPWSLFEMPELSVVIAGLNSTLAETHQKRDRHGWLGPEQLSWFVENLSRYRDRGWIRLAALHHSVHESVPSQDRLQDVAALDRALGAGGLVDLVLHGRPVAGAPCRLPSGLLALGTGHTGPKTASCAGFHVPDQFQLLVIESGTVTRYARHYDAGQRRWIGDTRISPTGSDWYERFAFSERHSRFLGSGHGTVTGEVTAARSEPSVNLSVPDTTDRTALSRRSGSSGPVRMSTERAYGPGSESIANTATAPVRRSDDEELVHRVLEATLARLPEATVTVAGPPESRYLRVSAPLPGRSGADQWPVGVVAEPTVEAVSGFVRHVHARFWAADPSVPSELVHAGPPASAGLMERARLAGVRLRSFVDYQGLLDLRPLIERQAGQLFGDRVYPAALYVPQRYRSVDGEVAEGLLQRVTGWLGHDTARFVMVLGDFGRGKTVLLRQLARTLPTELPGVLPVLVELRSLEKAPSLDELLGQHLIRNGVEDVNPRKLQYMIRSGRLALLFDGFDELELRVGYDNAADYLQVLLRSVTDRAKVVLTSRTQHFRSTEQVRTALGDRVAGLGASRVVILEDFSRHQILRFLTNRYGGDEEAAIRRYRLLGEVEDLLGLSRNPRMLDFVAALDEHRLRDIQAQHGRISAAELYRELVDFWLVGEAGRQRHRQGMPSLDECERLDACTALALRLWSAPADRIPTAEFSAQVSTTLTRLVERGYTTEQAAHAIGSGSLLVRTEDDAFTFVHQSIVEWLVAHVVARELRAHRSSTPLTTRRMTKLMVDFLIDLVGVPLAQDWARQTLMSSCCSQRAKQNALQVTTRIPAVLAEKPRGATASDVQDQERVDLRGIDLRGQDLTGLDLSSAVLSGADLRGMRLERVNLTEADLTHARFEGATLAGG
ncbi:MAG: hypothetical protein QG608_1097, partial [Actinomycetota bacterium]|nr:hypothetical protein [Actinomycetota bacterium]